MLSRRSALIGASAASLALALGTPAARAANANGTRVGAIRWDAWYSNTGVDTAQAQHNLDQPQYQARAPFFATQVGPGLMSIVGAQAAIDAEISYAANAGVKYWAYCFYGFVPATGIDADFVNAWSYHQASALKAQVNWCWIMSSATLTALTSAQLQTLAAQLGQSNYEPGLSGRPLIYLRADITASAAASAITALRNACSSAGVGNPYVGWAGTAADLTTAGADVLWDYAYAPSPVSNASYATLDSATQAYWATRSAAKPIIPIAMTGYDRRPRIERPVRWEVATGQAPYVGMSNNFGQGTAAQVAAHVQSCLTWIGNNASACPTNHILAYAWDEFDEGGWLCPTWTASGPDNSRLAALTGVI